MLLAAPLGENPRDVAGGCGAELERELGRERQRRADRGRRPRLRQPLPRRRLVPAGDGGARRRRRGPRPGPDRVARTDPGRVRLRQPDRPAARRRRPPRRLRRRPRAPARGGRPRGAARVLRQRRRRPGRALRRLDRRPDGRRRAARGRLRAASTSPSWPSGSPPRGSTPTDTEAVGTARRRAGARGRAGDPRALRRPLRHLVLRARPLQPRRGRGGAGAARRGRPHLPQRGGALAADHRVRRRQGPGADPRQRRADLPRRRRRLPLGQARARLRAA